MAQQVYFSAVAAAAAAQQNIGLAFLAEFDFPGEFMRLHTANGIIQAGGHEWTGLGEFVSFGTVLGAAGDAAAEFPITLSGASKEMIALANRDHASIRNRRVSLYMWFFNPATWKEIEPPVMIATYQMKRMIVAGNAYQQSITLICEGMLTSRSKPPAGLLTSADQKRRSPGDKGLDERALVAQKRVPWPAG